MRTEYDTASIPAASPKTYKPSAPHDLHQVLHERRNNFAEQHNLMREMWGVYNGILPARFMDYFREDQPVKLINMVRQAADDLAGMTGQEFPLFSAPENDSAKAKKAAELREKVCYGYNAAGRHKGGIDMRGLMSVGASHMVLGAQAVYLALPDFERKTPFFTFKHSLTYYPPVGYSPWESTELDHCLFAYQVNLAKLKARYPDKAGELSRAYSERTTAYNGKKLSDEQIECWVGEYYCKDAWYVATMDDKVVTLVGSESGDKNHPGVCPVVEMSVYNSEIPRSLLADQVALMASTSVMVGQKIEFANKKLWPTKFGSKLVGDILQEGPGSYNVFATEAGEKPFYVEEGAQSNLDMDRTLDFVIGVQRMLNRNPESLQGAGEANSAKAISELKGSVSSTVQDHFWPPFFQGLPKLYAKAMRMDINLWGSEKKQIGGRTPEYHKESRGIPFNLSYRPVQDLRGFEDSIEIEPGIMLRGYQGRLELMQLKGAGLISTDTALEQSDVIRDPSEEKRRIQNDQLESLLFSDLAMKAQGGGLQPGALAEIKRRVNGKGEDLFDVVGELQAAGMLEVPPAPPPGMEGAPPGLEALMGGGPPAAPPSPEEAPSLELLRGGAAA